MKKQYISPVAEVFECKVNAMMMNSVTESLDDLLVDDNVSILPSEDEFDGVFSAHGDDFVWEEE